MNRCAPLLALKDTLHSAVCVQAATRAPVDVSKISIANGVPPTSRLDLASSKIAAPLLTNVLLAVRLSVSGLVGWTASGVWGVAAGELAGEVGVVVGATGAGAGGGAPRGARAGP